ncbi:hypothetical protein [Enterovirga aerilata]|uniref:Uncharacterized protein n=1 Tax=Enterovirga aerilata TaxID=2730920 RepID=A0A849I3J1_9HYPH|nr:hypothetical protein [Enterovirga sp. DB1703]NNM71928.1 hypothetical protein [Enterovirga sp. DB1703]
MYRSAACVLLVLSTGAAEARPCRPGEAPRFSAAGRPSCDNGERLRPHDPEGQRVGRRPGFIDLGNGTEVRIGGRVQMDYDTRR